MSSVFITGSSGFIGRAIAGAFQREGASVLGTTRKAEKLPWPTLTHDWTRPFQGAKQNADIFIHAAFDSTLKSNVEMAQMAGAAAKSVGARRVVLISSGSVYAESDMMITSNTALAPARGASEYTKHCQEVEVAFAIAAAGTPLSVVRLFYPYGPLESVERLIPRLIKRIRGGDAIELHRDGRPRINPVYIDDAAEAIRLIAIASAPHTVNVGGPESITIEKLAHEIGTMLKATPFFEIAKENWNALDLCCDISALVKATGFKPAIGIRDGLTRMLASQPKN